MRLNRIYEVVTNKDNDLETSINKLKPPIFWKDKPSFLEQSRIWSSTKIKKLMEKLTNLKYN